MSGIYTIDGAGPLGSHGRGRKRKASRPMPPGTCRTVEMKDGCTISLCRPERGGRPKFKRGTKRC